MPTSLLASTYSDPDQTNVDGTGELIARWSLVQTAIEMIFGMMLGGSVQKAAVLWSALRDIPSQVDVLSRLSEICLRDEPELHEELAFSLALYASLNREVERILHPSFAWAHGAGERSVYQLILKQTLSRPPPSSGSDTKPPATQNLILQIEDLRQRLVRWRSEFWGIETV